MSICQSSSSSVLPVLSSFLIILLVVLSTTYSVLISYSRSLFTLAFFMSVPLISFFDLLRSYFTKYRGIKLANKNDKYTIAPM